MHRQTKQMESLFAHLGILLILFHSSFPSSSFHSSSLCNSCLVLPAELQSSWISWEIKTIQYIIILYYYKYCVCAQLCPTLCNPMDCSPPGSFVHGILQARILECHFLLQGIFPDPGIEPTSLVSPALAGKFFTTVPPGKPITSIMQYQNYLLCVAVTMVPIFSRTFHLFCLCSFYSSMYLADRHLVTQLLFK